MLKCVAYKCKKKKNNSKNVLLNRNHNFQVKIYAKSGIQWNYDYNSCEGDELLCNL